MTGRGGRMGLKEGPSQDRGTGREVVGAGLAAAEIGNGACRCMQKRIKIGGGRVRKGRDGE